MFSKVILEKACGRKKRVAVVRGVEHVAPEEQFRALQEEMEQTVEKGSVVFYEGVSSAPHIPVPTKNGRRLEIFFGQMIIKGYKAMAAKKGLVVQNNTLRFTELHAVKADMTLQEFVNFLDKEGVRCSRLLCWMFELAFKLEGAPRWVSFFDKMSGELLGRAVGRYIKRSCAVIFKQAEPILYGRRNEIIFAQVKELGGKNDLYLVYGNKHIPGIVKLFEEDGWGVVNIKDSPLSVFS